MSLWTDLFVNEEEDDTLPWSQAAGRAIGKSVVPLHIYNLGGDTFVKFGWNCATFSSAVSIAKVYVRSRFDAIDIEVIVGDDVWKREFSLRFTRND